jgi:acetyltransferase EpsM
MHREICLYGASGHGKVIKDIALSQNKKAIFFFDDNPNLESFKSVPVLSSKNIGKFLRFNFIVSIGDNLIRKKISNSIKVNFDTLIDVKSIISETVIIKEGTVVMPFAIINADSTIGRHCIINTSSIVEHDCIIEDFVHISPNATITGGVTIGEGAHVGAGAIIIPGIKVGKWVTIAAGAVIIKDVPDYAVIVGNPGRIIKYKEEENE